MLVGTKITHDAFDSFSAIAAARASGLSIGGGFVRNHVSNQSRCAFFALSTPKRGSFFSISVNLAPKGLLHGSIEPGRARRRTHH